MRVVGLTGGIASGKSTVAAMLRDLGAPVIDADASYHALLEPRDGAPSELARALGQAFPGILRPDGVVERKALGARVFGDRDARARLEALTHPAVAQAMASAVVELAAKGHRVAFYDVPLLYEVGLAATLPEVVVVWVPPAVQRARLRERDGLDEGAIAQRLAAQLPLDDKRARATWVIDNSGDLEATRRQVIALWREVSS